MTRSAPFDWKAQGFLVGLPVHISGFGGQVWEVVGFSDDFDGDTTDNTVMHLKLVVPAACPTPPLQPTATLTVPGVTVERLRLRWHADPRGRQLDRRRLRDQPAGHDHGPDRGVARPVGDRR